MACAGNVILSHSIYGLKERLQGTSASGAVPYSRRSIPAYMTIVALISIEEGLEIVTGLRDIGPESFVCDLLTLMVPDDGRRFYS